MRALSLLSMFAAASLACGPAAPDDTSAVASDAPPGTSSDASTGTTGAATGTGDPPTTTAATSTGSTTAPADPAVCAAAELLELAAVKATPVAGPTWSPGEQLVIEATLRNPSGADFLAYPGIRVAADHPDVTSDAPENWLFALLAGTDEIVAVVFLAAPAAAPATVRFTVEIVALNQACPDLARTTVEVPLVPP